MQRAEVGGASGKDGGDPPAKWGWAWARQIQKIQGNGGVGGGGGGAQGESEEQERGVSEGPGLTPPSPA